MVAFAFFPWDGRSSFSFDVTLSVPCRQFGSTFGANKQYNARVRELIGEHIPQLFVRM